MMPFFIIPIDLRTSGSLIKKSFLFFKYSKIDKLLLGGAAIFWIGAPFEPAVTNIEIASIEGYCDANLDICWLFFKDFLLKNKSIHSLDINKKNPKY